MPLQHNADVKCPQCGCPGTFEIRDIINAGLDSDMREKVFTEELFRWTCPHCGQVVYYPYGFIYNDMDHKFMLFFNPDEPKDGNKYKPMKIEAPLRLMDDYVFRPVFGIRNLKEKITILENGLNDLAIERIKYFFKHLIAPAELIDAEFFIFIEKILPREDNNMKEELVFGYKSHGQEEPRAFSVCKKEYDQALEAIELDPRFKDTGIHCVDEGWIGMKIKTV
jgi:predicted nucleic-acid-binding Zn-ribbon protein